ncbi:MAG TPA: FliA/WhiG family RNA polymerase sigma factor [Myxococcota bacterium]
MTNATSTASTTTRTAATAAAAGRIEDHLPLVWKVARSVARRLPSHIDAEELVGAGTLGLVDAWSRYDHERCDRFGAWAEIRIRGAILDQLREMDWMPRSARNKRKRLDSEKNKLSNTLGRTPDSSELAEALDMSVASMERMRADIERADVQRGVAFDEATIAAGDEFAPGAGLEQRELRARLAAAIGSLTTKQQQILSLYYVDELKLKEIGQIFGVTESRVCQLHRELIARLRAAVIDD